MLVSSTCRTISEIVVFDACMAWLRAASKRETIDKKLVQEYLGESFDDIRFGLMTADEVNDIFKSYENLFSAGERPGSESKTSKIGDSQPNTTQQLSRWQEEPNQMYPTNAL